MPTQKRPIAKVTTKRLANEQYRLACKEPYLWMQKAGEVRRAADVLWGIFELELTSHSTGKYSHGPFFGDTALMLYGLVVENLFKALLTDRGLSASPTGNFSQKSHDLLALATKLDFLLDDSEAELLERLQNFVEWAGRYPIPLYADGLYSRQLVAGGEGALYGISSLDGVRISAILSRIEAMLPSEGEALSRYASGYGA